MVLTRSATAKLAAQDAEKVKLVDYSSSDSLSEGDTYSDNDSSSSDMDIESETDSTDNSESSDDFDHVNVDDDDDKPVLYDMLMEAFLGEDWLNSRFHQRMIDLYIRPLLSFNQSGSASLTDHIHNITESKRITVDNVGNKIQICPLCNLTKTTSRRIETIDEFGRSRYMEVGRHCADRYMSAVKFYKDMDKFFYDEQGRILDHLNKAMCSLEDGMRRGPNPLLTE